jgi:Domain of unknown function (DUF4349)
MPSTPDIDERYSELTTLVRATRPRAPESLRQRVRVTAATAEPVRRQWFTTRRLALVLVAGALVALGGVLASRDGGDRVSSEAGGGEGAVSEAQRGGPVAGADDATVTSPPATALERTAPSQSTLPPSGTRLQDYRADLTVRVEDTEALSSATASAMRTARSLGGYVVTARYDTPGDDEGDSYLVVRVPVNRVQDAILRFTQLGTIVSQSIQVEDLQNQVNRQTESIASLRRTITRIEELLKDPTLPIEQRAELEVRLLNAKDQLNRAVNAKEQTVRRASLARVALTLTTRDELKPVEPKNPGYFEQTIRDAAASLEKVGAWIVAGAIVGGPFLLLLGAVWLAARSRRRRSDQRLLDRPQP